MGGEPAWVRGALETAAGAVPVVRTRLDLRDRLGALAVRCGIGRGSFRVAPGLYAAGLPGPGSPVLVTANYKLSLDALRRELAAVDAWILVLDTRGVNVWCAAGNGTFGTEEIARRVAASRLGSVVAHRRLIVPQLGAPGVSATETRRLSGFSVSYGPVRASDLPAYLADGMRASPEMRRVRFGVSSRLALVPVEVAHALPAAVGVLLVAGALAALRSGRLDLPAALRLGLCVWGAMAAGAIALPLLLPLLPGKAFAPKGAILGLLWAAAAVAACRPSAVGAAGLLLLLPAVAAYLALQFTGSTTFTSLSGVQIEVRLATPLIVGVGGLGAVLTIVAFLNGGIL